MRLKNTPRLRHALAVVALLGLFLTLVGGGIVYVERHRSPAVIQTSETIAGWR